MNEPKRYFTSKLGFADGTDYIEFDNGNVTLVFTNGARQKTNGIKIGQLEDAVERQVYDEYAKPPAGTIRSIIEKLENLAAANGLIDEKQIEKFAKTATESIDMSVKAFNNKSQERFKEELGIVFATLVTLCKAGGTDLISCARKGYEEIQSALVASNDEKIIPVAFKKK